MIQSGVVICDRTVVHLGAHPAAPAARIGILTVVRTGKVALPTGEKISDWLEFHARIHEGLLNNWMSL